MLQDPKSYQNKRNAMGMLKFLSQGEADIRSGQVMSQQDVFGRMESILNGRK